MGEIRDEDFYEEDEPIEQLLADWDKGEVLYTEAPSNGQNVRMKRRWNLPKMPLQIVRDPATR
jgi:hypothetical protein